MTVTTQAFLVTQRFGERLADGDADIFYRVMCVDMQIADRRNLQINQPVTGKLIEHMVKESDAGIELGNAGTIKIECHANFGFQRIASDFGLPHGLLHIVS